MRRCCRHRPPLRKGNGGGKALQRLSRPLQSKERKSPSNRKPADKRFAGLSAGLPIQRRRKAAKAGCKPGSCRLELFAVPRFSRRSGAGGGTACPAVRHGTRDGRFFIRPGSAGMVALRFAGSPPWFLAASKAIAPSRRQWLLQAIRLIGGSQCGAPVVWRLL